MTAQATVPRIVDDPTAQRLLRQYECGPAQLAGNGDAFFERRHQPARVPELLPSEERRLLVAHVRQQGDFVLNHLLVIQSGLIDGFVIRAHFGRHLFQVGLQLSGILQNQISVTCDLQVFFDLING